MGNRQGGEKAKEEKKKKKKKEKKIKSRNKRKPANSDVDLDPESSHVSRADSESMVFHSAENLSPYLDASTRCEGTGGTGFYDDDSIMTSSDFQDGFSIEACLPAELALTSRRAGEAGGCGGGSGAAAAAKVAADDAASIASAGYSTPLLSSPQIRRGQPRSPLAQRPKDSFYEPVPPIPSDFSSSNTMTSSSYQDDLSTSGERSSSRASSSTLDTNAATCIERLEELERTIERTIIEKFSDLDGSAFTRHEGAFGSEHSPLAVRRIAGADKDHSREGSLTPRGAATASGASQSAENSPNAPRRRPFLREGSSTPMGTYFGLPSRSVESSPVLVKKIQQTPQETGIAAKTSVASSYSLTRTGPGSPVTTRAGPGSPVTTRAGPGSPVTTTAGPASQAATRPGLGSPLSARPGPGSLLTTRPGPGSSLPIKPGPGSPLLTRPGPANLVPTQAGPGYQQGSCSIAKPAVLVDSPVFYRKLPGVHEDARQASTGHASPGAVKRFQTPEDVKGTSYYTASAQQEEANARHFAPPTDVHISQAGQSSRSPDTRRRPGGAHTPSSSPSPRSLGRKVISVQAKADADVPGSPKPIRIFEASKGTPVKHCIVTSQPSTAVVIPSPSVENVGAASFSARSQTVPAMASPVAARRNDVTSMPDAVAEVSEEAIIQGSESAVFGSVSPKLKRQRHACDSSHSQDRKSSFEEKRSEIGEVQARSPSSSPRFERPQRTSERTGDSTCNTMSKHSIHVIQYKDVDSSRICISTLKHPSKAQIIPGGSSPTPSSQQLVPPVSDVGVKVTYRSELSVQTIAGGAKGDAGSRTASESPMSSPTFHDAPETFDERAALAGPIHTRLQMLREHEHAAQGERARFEGRTVSAQEDAASESALLTGPHVHSSLPADSCGTEFYTRRDRFERGAFSRDSSVEEKERKLMRNAAGADEEAESQRRVRACEHRNTRTATCAKFVSTPLPLAESGSGTASKAIGKNLGERIREVIKECTTFREVFTAELSPDSSVDRDAGSSTDENFSPPGTTSRDRRPYFHKHPRHPTDRENCSHSKNVNSSSSRPHQRADRRLLSTDSDGFTPEAAAAVSATVADVKGMAAEEAAGHRFAHAQSSGSLERETSLSHVVVQEKVGASPKTVTVCRLETGASVTLPEQPEDRQLQRQQEKQATDSRGTARLVAEGAARSSAGTSQLHVENSAVFIQQTQMGNTGHSMNPDLHASKQTTQDDQRWTGVEPKQPESLPSDVSQGKDRDELSLSLPVLETSAEVFSSVEKGANQSALGVFHSGGVASLEFTAGNSLSRQLAYPSANSPSQRMPEAEEKRGSNYAGTANIPQTPPLPGHVVEVQTCSQSKADDTYRTAHDVATNRMTRAVATATDSGTRMHEPGVVADISNGLTVNSGSTEPLDNVVEVHNKTGNETKQNCKMSAEQRKTDLGSEQTMIGLEGGDEETVHLADTSVSQNSDPLTAERALLFAKTVSQPTETEPLLPPLEKDPPLAEHTPPQENDAPPPAEHVPPPTPSPMDVLEEEEEEAEQEEDEKAMTRACRDSNPSRRIPPDIQLFGETVVKRLSSLLEGRGADGEDEVVDEGCVPKDGQLTSAVDDTCVRDSEQCRRRQAPGQHSGHAVASASLSAGEGCTQDADHLQTIGCDVIRTAEQTVSQQDTDTAEARPDLHDSSQLPLSQVFDRSPARPLSATTLDTLSTDQDTSPSSKRTSTGSTATDETLTSFKTRSTTDSGEFEENCFELLESLVFVRSVDEDDACGDGFKSGKRPDVPEELSGSAWESRDKPRQKRRRQAGNALEVPGSRPDVTEPEPKRGSQRIRDVIDAYHDENSDDSYISSCSECASHRDISQELVLPADDDSAPRPHREQPQRNVTSGRKAKHCEGGGFSVSSDSDGGDSEAAQRQRDSPNVEESSLRIPEIEETFGELMSVKTFLEDLQDRTPTATTQPVFLAPADVRNKDFWSANRRSRTSPARTDRTESDLDTSEMRDDASTDSMYADDEDEGAEVVFQRSYSEEHGGSEVLLSCTIYNSSHDNDDGDSDDFWAEGTGAAGVGAAGGSVAEESYKQLEISADAAGSAFQNARLQMHDIHQHLQDLRRQMEMLQEDITSTSLTLTPDCSLESCEQRPVTE